MSIKKKKDCITKPKFKQSLKSQDKVTKKV